MYIYIYIYIHTKICIRCNIVDGRFIRLQVYLQYICNTKISNQQERCIHCIRYTSMTSGQRIHDNLILQHTHIYIIYFSIFIHTGKRKKQLCERACHTRISTTSLHDRLFHWNAHSRTSSTILSTSSNVIMTCAKIVCTRKTGNILINWIDRWYISRLYKNFWSILTFQRAPGQGPELWYPPWIWLNKVFQLTSQKGRERDQHLNLRTGSHL